MSVKKNVELKGEISSFSGLKLRQVFPSTNSMYRTRLWRWRNDGKFCNDTSIQSSRELHLSVLIKRTCNFSAEAEVLKN